MSIDGRTFHPDHELAEEIVQEAFPHLSGAQRDRAVFRVSRAIRYEREGNHLCACLNPYVVCAIHPGITE